MLGRVGNSRKMLIFVEVLGCLINGHLTPDKMLKRCMIVITVCVFLVLLIAGPVLADEEIYDYFHIVRLMIGEKEAEVDFEPATMEQPAYVKNGRTLVPFRFLGESLGAEISWNGNNQQAKLKLGGTEVTVIIGSKIAYVNGKMTTLDVPADWTISLQDNDSVVCFTSPRDSKMWVYYLLQKPNDGRLDAKQKAEDNGWTLIAEDLTDPTDSNKGCKVDFSKFDPKSGGDLRWVVYIDHIPR